MQIISLMEKALDYTATLELQKKYLNKRIAGKISDTLILLQHKPVYTFGRLADKKNLLANKSDLEKKGVPVIKTGRGGDITYHAPGQLIIYPLFNLKKVENDLHRYLRLLEDAIITTLGRLGITGERIEGKTGVYVAGEKIAFIGIGVKRWVSYHGIALNVDINLNGFSKIIPCGLKDIKVTSIKKVLSKSVSLDRVAKMLSADLSAKWSMAELNHTLL